MSHSFSARRRLRAVEERERKGGGGGDSKQAVSRAVLSVSFYRGPRGRGSHDAGTGRGGGEFLAELGLF